MHTIHLKRFNMGVAVALTVILVVFILPLTTLAEVTAPVIPDTSPVSRRLGQYTLHSIVAAAFDAIIAIMIIAIFAIGCVTKQEAKKNTEATEKNISGQTCIFLPSFS